MTVKTHAAESFSFYFSLAIFTTHIMYFMAHSFYAYLAPPIVVGVLLTYQSLDPGYKTTAFFSDVFPRKKHNLIFWLIWYL